ncbi:hypothetical protein [Pendulispora albinea]|uniref:Uncharacterized protein n=1 Tax=Pendulispora albinea TaxID=2741071 RepID=A0ABZ2LUT2_9BACT
MIDATSRASLTTLGRDQGIFQYVAWALKQGAVDYRDVRDVNGPLTHLVHMVLLAFGGADEHRFRVLDLTITGIGFAFAGACLPGVIKKKVTWLDRAAWAFAGWVVLSGQHVMYLYWDLAQRESFFDWFMLSAVALQLAAQRGLARGAAVGGGPGALPPRGAASIVARAWPIALAAGLGAITWFGKPTYVVFTVVQLVALVVDRELGLSQKQRLGVFALGAAVGAATQLAFLVAYADVGAFLRIYFVDVPAMYRFMLPRTPVEILSPQWGGTAAAIAITTMVVHLGLIAEGHLPRRTIGVALVPLAGLVSVLAQAKGFGYHFHPVTAGMHMQWLLLIVWLWEKFGRAPRTRPLARLVPYAAGTALAMKLGVVLPSSPHVQDLWILGKARDRVDRESHDYLIYFRDKDFFPWEMRQTARYLQEHTRPDERVQIYGMDPYLLFLAGRMSATPYIYVYDLNVDAALGGSWMPDGVRPNPKQADVIVKMRDAHERDMLDRLKLAPPAAFVFFDKSPLTSNESAVVDFTEHCPESAAWVRERYRETAVFGEDRVWMRNDVAERIAAAPVSN